MNIATHHSQLLSLTKKELEEQLEYHQQKVEVNDGRLSSNSSADLDFHLDMIDDIQIEQAIRLLVSKGVRAKDIVNWCQLSREKN